jgi:hypothetical protein
MALPQFDDADVCGSLDEELGKLCGVVNERWRSLNTQLEEHEEKVFQDHGDFFKKWFGLDAARISCWEEGSLRSKVRDRVQKLVLVPFVENLRQQLASSPATNEFESAATSPDAHPVSTLLEEWEREVEPLVKEAKDADGKLTRKIRRMERNGATKDAKLEEAFRVPTLWRPVRAKLDEVLPLARRLSDIVVCAASDEAVAGLCRALPALVGRAVCDCYFDRCCAELDQLEGWWSGARAALQRRPALWERLLESEGIQVRRVDRGIEELCGERWGYSALAKFGSSPLDTNALVDSDCAWPAEPLTLLAQAITTMRRRLRSIRDSAAWRVIDVAKALQKELFAQRPKTSDRPLWERIGIEEGIVALCDALDAARPPKGLELRAAPNEILSLRGMDVADAALVYMQRLDRLVAVASEVKDFPDLEGVPDTGGYSYIFMEMMQGLSYFSEELLGVMDEPEEDCLRSWMQEWIDWGDDIGGHRLESAVAGMPLKADSVSTEPELASRRKRLALLRGVQAMIDRPGFRAWLVRAPPRRHGAVATDANSVHFAAPDSDDNLELSAPPEPEVSATVAAVCTTSPRDHEGHEAMQQQERSENEPVADKPLAASAEAVESVDATKLAVEAPFTAAAATVVAASCDANITASGACHLVARTAGAHDVVSSAVEVCTADAVKPGDAAVRAAATASPSLTNTPAPSSQKVSAASRSVDETEEPAPFSVAQPNMGRTSSSPSLSKNSDTVASSCPSPATMSRPVTPSWLEPPWPRAQMSSSSSSLGSSLGFGKFSMRPDTASTACDEDEFRPNSAAAPRWKHVDGSFVPLRPMKLPPLISSPLRPSR